MAITWGVRGEGTLAFDAEELGLSLSFFLSPLAASAQARGLVQRLHRGAGDQEGQLYGILYKSDTSCSSLPLFPISLYFLPLPSVCI